MEKSTSLSSQLAQEVLQNPPAAALPSNLADRWLDIALHGAERLVQADEDADPELVQVPINLVLHLLSEKLQVTTPAMSDEKLLTYLAHYRIELAMEKLRRWGVVLAPAADKTTIFYSRNPSAANKPSRRPSKR